MGKAMQATDSFACQIDGYEYDVSVGDIVDSDHVVVRSNPGYFGELNYRFAVEEATAAPGRKRATKAKPDAAK